MEINRVYSTPVRQLRHGEVHEVLDNVAIEEPLEIRLLYGELTNRKRKSLYVTMRTPGHDFELVVGFLFAEGMITQHADILRLEYGITTKHERLDNVVVVTLSPHVVIDPKTVQRDFIVNSACGICGKTSIEQIQSNYCEWSDNEEVVEVDEQVVLSLPAFLYEKQQLFQQTGGVHGVALFDPKGNFLLSREDIGRHNAMDKLVGALLTENKLPITNKILLLSGRASFELLQKSIMAGARVVVAVGAPSSLAVQLAREFKVKLYGFVKEGRFNEYL